ncbi:hypothetical protein DFH28DRAFT_1132529 [Melampsora americana]|nr:hypothetical protein DFH28DRAFT_1132529 [Melampsora americana]
MSKNQHLDPVFLGISQTNKNTSLPPRSESCEPEVLADLTNGFDFPSRTRGNSANRAADLEDGPFKFNFDCDFYVPNKQNKSGYHQITCSNCMIDWDSNNFNLDELKLKCTDLAKSDNTGAHIKSVLNKVILNEESGGVWTLYIASSHRFPKTNRNRKVLGVSNFQQWVEDAHASYPKNKAGISFVAPHPSKIKTQAEAAAQTEAVIAHAERQARRQARRPSDTFDSDSENGHSDHSINSQDDAVTAFANKLFEKYEMNKKYNKTYPAIIDPTDSSRYFALTWKKAKEWAKHRNDDEVSLNNPPAHFKYDITKSWAKQNDTPPHPSTSTTPFNPAGFTELLVGMVAAIEATRSPTKPSSVDQSPSNSIVVQPATRPASPEGLRALSPSPPLADDPSSETGTNGFLDFCQFSAEKSNNIKRILEELSVTDYRLINEKDLSRQDLLDRGLPNITATMVYNNAIKYRDSLIHKRTKAKRIRHGL